MAIFHQMGLDDQHLLLYVFHSLQRLLGNLAQSLGKDATQSDVLQTLDEHYGVVMMFDALSRELYSLKQGVGENVAEFGCVCPGRSRYSSESTWEGFSPNVWWR